MSLYPPQPPGPFERAEIAKATRAMWFKIVRWTVLAVVIIVLGCWQPLIAGYIVLALAFAGMIYLFVKMHDKCPRCFTKLERHPKYSNADVCPSCNYLRVNE